MNRAIAPMLFLGLVGLACRTEQAPLPEDVYENGWDETTQAQRTRLLRDNLEAQLDALGPFEPRSEKHRNKARQAALTLSSLRSELATSEDGKNEYLDIEAHAEAVIGDER